MLNSVRSRPKRSLLERDTGRYVILTFFILLFICTFCALTYSFWEEGNREVVEKYITKDTHSFIYNFATKFGTTLLIFGNFVPISMLLTLETAKFCQGYLIGIDQGLVASNKIECHVNSSSLNEELGQVDYIFSDKTGTLTRNEMRFKYLIVGNTVYGEQTGYTGNVPEGIKNVEFSDPRAWQVLYSGRGGNDYNALFDAVKLLALCHTIVVEKSGEYNASSPDELAFVNFSKLVGCEFKGIDDDNNISLNELGQPGSYKLLEVIEFNSDRKRMSVIVQNVKTNEITLYTKGADSIMIPRYNQESAQLIKSISVNVDKYADIGLRTLFLGKKNLSQSEFSQFKSQYDAAKNNLTDRDKAMGVVEDSLEKGLTLVGATAVEDRLQDQVGKDLVTFS